MRWLFVLLIGVLVTPALAQADEPLISPIAYNSTVQETITAAAPFDWWQVQASPGDAIRLQVIASDGLAPQAAILSPAGDRVATSAEGAINGRVVLEYTVPDAGMYTVVVTDVGETTGGYTLTFQRVNSESSPSSDVIFLCNGDEMAALASVAFTREDSDAAMYPLYVYGFDGLLPAIRVQFSEQNIDVCHRDAHQQAGDVITLPGADPVTLEADQLDTASQLNANAGETPLGTITISFGAEAGTSGRFLAIIGGFGIAPNNDTDTLQARAGGLANRSIPMQLYMVGTGANNRLDPFMRFPTSGMECDDAGRRTCADVPSFNGAGVVFNTGEQVVGDRFDAGLNFEVGNPAWQEVELGSFSGNTGGEYALVLVGELPPRTADEPE
jgi:hypothetical protein